LPEPGASVIIIARRPETAEDPVRESSKSRRCEAIVADLATREGADERGTSVALIRQLIPLEGRATAEDPSRIVNIGSIDGHSVGPYHNHGDAVVNPTARAGASVAGCVVPVGGGLAINTWGRENE
jgi:hypothetical protein